MLQAALYEPDETPAPHEVWRRAQAYAQWLSRLERGIRRLKLCPSLGASYPMRDIDMMGAIQAFHEQREKAEIRALWQTASNSS